MTNLSNRVTTLHKMWKMRKMKLPCHPFPPLCCIWRNPFWVSSWESWTPNPPRKWPSWRSWRWRTSESKHKNKIDLDVAEKASNAQLAPSNECFYNKPVALQGSMNRLTANTKHKTLDSPCAGRRMDRGICQICLRTLHLTSSISPVQGLVRFRHISQA